MNIKRNKNSENPDSEISIKLLPRSSKNQIIIKANDVYRIKVTSPPIDGKANKALINILSKQLGIAKGNIEIISGRTSKNKRVRVKGLTKVEITQRMGG
ncbi:DUF167 domain-containing protein [Thermodesulfobacteriota bacterium]